MIDSKIHSFTLHDLGLVSRAKLKLKGIDLLDTTDPALTHALAEFGYGYIRANIEENCYMYKATLQNRGQYELTPTPGIHFVSQDVTDKKSQDPFIALTQIATTGEFQGSDHPNSYLVGETNPKPIFPPQKLLSQRRIHSQELHTYGDMYQLQIQAGFSGKHAQPTSVSPEAPVEANITYCAIGLFSVAIILATGCDTAQRQDYYTSRLLNHQFKLPISIYDSNHQQIHSIT